MFCGFLFLLFFFLWFLGVGLLIFLFFGLSFIFVKSIWVIMVFNGWVFLFFSFVLRWVSIFCFGNVLSIICFVIWYKFRNGEFCFVLLLIFDFYYVYVLCLKNNDLINDWFNGDNFLLCKIFVYNSCVWVFLLGIYFSGWFCVFIMFCVLIIIINNVK